MQFSLYLARWAMLLLAGVICLCASLAGQNRYNPGPPRNLAPPYPPETHLRDKNSTSVQFFESLSTLKSVRSNGWKVLLKEVIKSDQYPPERRKACLCFYLSQYFMPGMSLSDLVADGIVEVSWLRATNMGVRHRNLIDVHTAKDILSADQLIVMIRPDFLPPNVGAPVHLTCDIREYQNWMDGISGVQKVDPTLRPRVTVNVIMCEVE